MANQTIRSASDSAKTRLRVALKEMSGQMAEERRSYRSLDGTIFTLYAIECFLQALASSPRGGDFVLKGGNLFRVWHDIKGFRPTGDLDMQCSDDVHEFRDVADLRAEVAAVVCTDAFREDTGLVFDLEGFKLDPIRKGALVAYRLDGKVLLGEPIVSGPRPTEIPFCLEVTYGKPPEGAVELSRWESIMPKMGGFGLQSSKQEWMAAEKFHSVVTRGVANTRLKDFRDLMLLLRTPTFDDRLMRRCIGQVFEELAQTHLIPESALGIQTLSPAFATLQNEFLWQGRRWPEWEGRQWEAGRDPTLAEAMASILVMLERRGVLAEGSAARTVIALSDVCTAAGDLERDGPTPLLSARFASALKVLAARAGESRAGDVAWRWQGMARGLGLVGSSASQALERSMAVARELGLSPALDRGWDRGRGGGTEAIRILAEQMEESLPLRSASVGTLGASVSGPLTNPVPKPVKRARGSAAASVSTPDDIMASGILLLREGRPGTHVWFGGLAKVISASDAAVPDVGNLVLDVPTDPRAPSIWIQIAKRQRIEEDLARAVEMARGILCLDTVHPGPTRGG